MSLAVLLLGCIGSGAMPLHLSAGTAWFVQHQTKCPHPNQVLKRPLLVLLLSFIPPQSRVEDEAFLSLLGTETCGVHSVVFAGGESKAAAAALAEGSV